jgi:hypothetical protein
VIEGENSVVCRPALAIIAKQEAGEENKTLKRRRKLVNFE